MANPVDQQRRVLKQSVKDFERRLRRWEDLKKRQHRLPPREQIMIANVMRELAERRDMCLRQLEELESNRVSVGR